MRAFGCAAAALLALIVAPSAQGESLAIVTGKDYVPFTSPDLPEQGVATAVLRAALNAQGHDMDLRFLPWGRGYRLTANGEVDGTFPYIQTEKRREEVRFSDPIFEVIPKIISSADDPVRFDGTAASIEGRQLCLPVGYATEPLLEDMIDDGRLGLVETNKLAKCLAVVQKDRADFMVHNNFVWPSLIADSSYSAAAFHVADEGVSRNQLYFIVGKAHPQTDAILDMVNRGLAAIRADGTFDAIVERHLGGAAGQAP